MGNQDAIPISYLPERNFLSPELPLRETVVLSGEEVLNPKRPPAWSERAEFLVEGASPELSVRVFGGGVRGFSSSEVWLAHWRVGVGVLGSQGRADADKSEGNSLFAHPGNAGAQGF